jgi:hypothetical protein
MQLVGSYSDINFYKVNLSRRKFLSLGIELPQIVGVVVLNYVGILILNLVLVQGLNIIGLLIKLL